MVFELFLWYSFAIDASGIANRLQAKCYHGYATGDGTAENAAHVTEAYKQNQAIVWCLRCNKTANDKFSRRDDNKKELNFCTNGRYKTRFN